MTDAGNDAASRLWGAAANGVPCAPVRDLIDSIDEAYAVQQRNVARSVDSGETVTGRKIGLTSEAIQRQLGVDQPDFGAITASRSVASGAILRRDLFLQPRVEAEVALVLGADLDLPSPTIEDVIAATDYVAAAIEIVDSRIADWDITLIDTIADNASFGALVMGTDRVQVGDIDLPSLAMSLFVNGEIRSEGTGADCLGNPLNSAKWLAGTMALHGTPLRAGDVVLTGALGPMVSVAAGDTVLAHLGDLGSVNVEFSVAPKEDQ